MYQFEMKDRNDRIGAWERILGIVSIVDFSVNGVRSLMQNQLFTKLRAMTEKREHFTAILDGLAHETCPHRLLASEMLRISGLPPFLVPLTMREFLLFPLLDQPPPGYFRGIAGQTRLGSSSPANCAVDSYCTPASNFPQ